jgi:hypothetical protein
MIGWLKSALKCDWLKEGAISARIALLGVHAIRAEIAHL